MKKYGLILIILCLSINLFAFADEDWSSYDNIDNAWDGQKAITNKQFEETINALQAKKKKKEDKQKEKAIKKVKGSSLIPQMDAHNDNMSTPEPVSNFEEGELISIPIDFISDGKLIDRGFYKVTGVKQNNEVYILLYQAHTLVAKLKARETDDDFNEQAIQFTRLLPVNEHQMKIIYGCLDFNAYVYIDYEEPQATF
jgi:hypothetical protein